MTSKSTTPSRSLEPQSDREAEKYRRRLERTIANLERTVANFEAKSAGDEANLIQAQKRIAELEEQVDDLEVEILFQHQDKNAVIHSSPKDSHVERSNMVGDVQKVKMLEAQVSKLGDFNKALLRELQNVIVASEDLVNCQTPRRDRLQSVADQLKTTVQHGTSEAERLKTSAKRRIDSGLIMSSRYLETEAERLASDVELVVSARNTVLEQVMSETESLSKLVKVCEVARTRIGKPPTKKPARPSRSPAELEMLRLKNRETLHSLRN